jgi:hypothetical protein
MLQQRDSLLWHKTNALTRHALVRGLGNAFADHLTVNEFPKSGGSWLALMLAKALGLPFPRNRLPMLTSSILHGHIMGPVGTRRHVIVWRDGRDVAVSWFYHMVVGHNLTSARTLAMVRGELGIAGTPTAQEHFKPALAHFLKRPAYPRFTWASFVDRWQPDTSAIHVRYEDVLKNPAGELQRLIRACGGPDLADEVIAGIVAQHSFRAQSGRKPGEESAGNYLRKGIAGDWKNHFDQDCCDMFEAAAGRQLRALGYEGGSEWATAPGQKRP